MAYEAVTAYDALREPVPPVNALSAYDAVPYKKP